MALVKHLRKGMKERSTIHKVVDCAYFIVDGKDGKYIQFDTYGTTDRVIVGKVSQSIQLSPKAIEELIEILKGF